MLEESRPATDHERAPPADVFGRRRGFGWRKLHSITGIVPVGIFLLGHLWAQVAALGGHDAYAAARSGIFSARWIEVVFVLVPLTYHAGFGILIALRSRANVEAYPLSRNWMYVAQRFTGLVTFAFVVWHVAHLWVPQVAGDLGASQMYPKLEAELSATTNGFPVMAVLTLAGVGAATFHFANGVWGFALSSGLVRSRSRQTALAAATVVLGVALFGLGADTVVYFATGSRMLPLRSAAPALERRRASSLGGPRAAGAGATPLPTARPTGAPRKGAPADPGKRP